MKTSNQPIVTKPQFARFSTCLATLAGIGVLALGTAGFITHAHAGQSNGRQVCQDLKEVVEIVQKSEVAELDQLAANFHGALSYGGDITAMMSLWTENSSITLNGTPHVGKAAVQAFFQGNGYFLNNWVSLAPEYKTQITIHGDTATITTQCVAIDLSVSPMVVKSVIQVNATCERIKGQWFFTSMNNTSPVPL
jgi:hypothetical protein